MKKKNPHLNKKRSIQLLIALTCMCMVSLNSSMALAQSTRHFYVTMGGAGNTSGTSWANAMDTTAFRNGLSIAIKGDTFWVVMGSYTPGVDTSNTFLIPNGVAVYGGFAGTETNVNQRNPNQNVTILDGINIIRNIVTINNADSTTVLDGFTITGAYNSVIGGAGGGIYISTDSSSNSYCNPVIKNCTFVHNRAWFGAGVFIHNTGSNISKPLFYNCTFNQNKAKSDAGGIYVWGESAFGAGLTAPTIKKCTFSDEYAEYGAAIYLDGDFKGNCHTIIDSCIFSNDSNLVYNGGAIYIDALNGFSVSRITNSIFKNNVAGEGGDIYENAASGRVQNVLSKCTMSNNGTPVNTEGGSIYTYAEGRGVVNDTIENSAFYNYNAGDGSVAFNYGGDFSGDNNVFYINTVFLKNKSAGEGTVSNTTGSGSCHTKFVNCTFIGNKSSSGAGQAIYNYYRSGLATVRDTVTNCILWDTASTMSTTSEIFDQIGNLTSTVSYSDIKYGWTGAGSNNINSKPLFVNAIAGNLQLRMGSPAINAGLNTAVPANITTDIAGNARIQKGIVDMGAFESPYTNCYTMDTTRAVTCWGVPYTFMSKNYLKSGNYHDTLTTATTCDSLFVLVLKVDTRPNSNWTLKHTGNTFTFVAADTTLKTYIWTFGDGGSANTYNSTHTYSNGGIYTVSLTVIDTYGCQETYTQIITVTTGIDNITETGILDIYPNPTESLLNIQVPTEITEGHIYIKNMMGEVIQIHQIRYTSTAQLDMSGLAVGLYFIQLQDDTHIFTSKVVKQ